MEKSKPRLSNIELLRIVAMALIIAAHLSYYGGAYYHTEGLDKFIASLFVIGGKLGVALFVMIGSFFMVKRQISFKAVFRLTMTSILVCFLCTAIIFIVREPISFKSLVIHNPMWMYWFVTDYIGLMLISPWLNKLINQMDYRSNRNLCFVLTLLCVLCPTSQLIPYFSNQFIWFVYLYILVGFFVKHKDVFNQEKRLIRIKKLVNKTYIFATGGGYVFMAYLVYISEKLFPLRNSGSIFLLVVALGLFLFFYRLNIGQNRLINWIAKGTFAAYLIHENYFLRDYLWNDILRCSQWYNSPYFFFYGILSTMSILLLGAVVTVIIDRVVYFVLDIVIVKKIITKFDTVLQ